MVRKPLKINQACILMLPIWLYGQRFPDTGYKVEVVPDEIVHIDFDRPVQALDSLENSHLKIYLSDNSSMGFYDKSNEVRWGSPLPGWVNFGITSRKHL